MARQIEGRPSPRDNSRPHGGMSVEQVLDMFRQHFIADVVANAIVYDLENQDIISDGDLKEVTRTPSGVEQNQFLHHCLKRKATKDTLVQVCDIMIGCRGNSRMNQVGKEMKIALETGIQQCPSVEAQDPVSQEVKVCPILPKPLQQVRQRVYRIYKQQSLREGQRTLQFTKVAVLQNAPKPRKQDDPDQAEFLKRFRDCGVRLSEGAEQVTVSHFLHKGSDQTRIIYGQPGTGKTTFLKHLCQRVADDEASDFSLVLYFPLREKAVSEALKNDSDAGLEQLMQYCIRGEESSTSAKALLECEGAKVLIIFDGADEVRGLMDSQDGSLLGALLEGRVLPQAHFIVSTRPGGCPLLQQHSTLFYEILGFDEEAVESYVKEFFKREPGKGEAMLSDLRARPDLMGGVYVPMNLLIFCSIYEMGVAGRSSFPATMTECYKSSIARTVTREKQKVKNTYRVDPSLTHLPSEVAQLLSSLGDLAFNGLTQEPPHYILQEGEVRDTFHATVRPDETLDDSTFAGLLHLHPDQDGLSSTLTFSHTTKQEWFAAYHLSLLPEAEQAAFWRKNRHNPKLAVVMKFFSGLTKLKSPVVSKAILPTSGGGLPSKCETDNPYLLYVFHALFESQNESLTQSIATQLNSHLTFQLYLTPFDTMAISHCLTKCKHLTELDMSHHSLSPTSFHHVCSVVRSNRRLQSLSLRVAQFSTEDARALCEAALSLKKLDLTVHNSSTHKALAGIFVLRTLEELFLSLFLDTEQPVGDSTVLEEKVPHCHLKRLQLYSDSRNLLPILSGAKDSSTITDLAVRDPSTSDEVASAVATCGKAMRQLRKLTITSINPLPLLLALGYRDCPLEHVTVQLPPWTLRRFSEEEWAQLEEAGSCAQVVKVEVKVYGLQGDGKGCTVLAAGLVRNKVLKEAEFTGVPKYLEEKVREILQANKELTVVVK